MTGMIESQDNRQEVSLSLFAKRVRQFKRIKRGWYSLIIVLTLYVLSFFNPYFFNNRALVMRYEGKLYFPVSMGKRVILESDLGREGYGEVDYLRLRKELMERKKNDPTLKDYVVMPIVPYSWNGRDRTDYQGLKLREDTGVLSVELLAPPNPPRQDRLLDPERVKSLLADPAIAKKYGIKPDWLHRALFDEAWTRDVIDNDEESRRILDRLPFVSKVLAGGAQVREMLEDREWTARVIDDPEWARSVLERYRELRDLTNHPADVKKILDDPRLARVILSDRDFAREALSDPDLALDVLYHQERYRKFKSHPGTVEKILSDPGWIAESLDKESLTSQSKESMKSALASFIEGENIRRAPMNHLLGTDKTGRDVLVRLAYGFRISITFALLVLVCTYSFGCALGAAMGYYAGKFDLIVHRLIEVWASMPFLYTIIIISSLIRPNFYLLIFVLAIFGWVGLTLYMRGEFYKEKRKDYVIAAVATGANDRQIIFQHILPNSLTPIISFAPFAIVSYISLLVALDYLGFGLPPPTPSWGEMVQKGLENVKNWWLVMCPLAAMFVTLLTVVFIGEAVREAFDPRAHQRLR